MLNSTLFFIKSKSNQPRKSKSDLLQKYFQKRNFECKLNPVKVSKSGAKPKPHIGMFVAHFSQLSPFDSLNSNLPVKDHCNSVSETICFIIITTCRKFEISSYFPVAESMWRCFSSANRQAFAAALSALARLSLLRATQINQISGKTPRSTRFQMLFCPQKRPKVTESFNYNPSNNSMCTDCPKHMIEFSD